MSSANVRTHGDAPAHVGEQHEHILRHDPTDDEQEKRPDQLSWSQGRNTEQRTRTGVSDDSIAYDVQKAKGTSEKHHELAGTRRSPTSRRRTTQPAGTRAYVAPEKLELNRKGRKQIKTHVGIGIWLCPRCLPHGTGRPDRPRARASQSQPIDRSTSTAGIIPSRFVRQGLKAHRRIGASHRILICHTKRRSATRNLPSDPGRYPIGGRSQPASKQAGRQAGLGGRRASSQLGRRSRPIYVAPRRAADGEVWAKPLEHHHISLSNQHCSSWLIAS